MAKPWEEEWTSDSISGEMHEWREYCYPPDVTQEKAARAQLAAAAPALARALCLAEWGNHYQDDESCPVCGAWNGKHDDGTHPAGYPACPLDAALTAAGLDAAAREAVRKAAT